MIKFIGPKRKLFEEGNFSLGISSPQTLIEGSSDGVYKDEHGNVYGNQLIINYENFYNQETYKLNDKSQGVLNLEGIYGENPYTKERRYIKNDRR